ncbi:uncharacterized protein DSM5745_07631 [Aspergillus mulundensis]|uniref:Uncharacterized protein n=1 Tax=Aspergillus mulundensis TaxID=1810919 RepID=A0A3D8REI7_9EURO|nr:Uncharacterized protein DSM5745_07631 [Aspergillus mulundensis]RDW72459.1 Uncharacterized protein DSM5745_07631 [Aspergillus mulundensis]
MAPGSFPKFADGNVKIAVLPDIYQLQSSVLEERSPILRLLLKRNRQETQYNTSRTCVSMNLVGSSAHKYGMLEVQDYDDSRCAIDETTMCSFPIWPEKTRVVWSNLFKIFYDIPALLDNNGLDSILENCQALVDLAEELQSSDVVCPAISTTLLGFDQQLYRLIAQDPISWVKLAVRMQSAPIFQESMVHLIGKWGLLEERDRETLPKSIRTLCTQKLHDLNGIKKIVELRITKRLPRLRSDNPHYQETRTSNVFGWMALSFCQQWLCESFAEGRNRHAPDGGAAFYRAVAAGGDASLTRVNQDISQFPSSPRASVGSTKGLKELEKALNELKEGMTGVVSDLLVNQAKYDPEILGELPHLTCCRVSEEEMPPAEVTFSLEMNSQLQGIGNDMTHIPNNSNVHQTFLPAGAAAIMGSTNVMMGFDNNINNYPLDPRLQNNDPNVFGYSAFNQQSTDPTLIWGSPAGFSSPNMPNYDNGGALPSISGITNTNDFFQAQAQAQFDGNSNLRGSLDMFDVPLLTDNDGYVHNGSDGSMAFL